jgi:hypothetical protein
MPQTMITARCTYCGLEFPRSRTAINRSLKASHRLTCSRRRASRLVPPRCKAPYPKGAMPVQLKPSNRLDEYSSFRKHFQMARLSALERRQEFSITLEDLKNRDSARSRAGNLDRIDSS